MTRSQRLELRASEIRTRLNELSGIETGELTDEQRSEIDTLSVEYADVESQKRAAIIAGDTPEDTPEPTDGGDAETREIDGLIQRSEIRNYLTAAAQGNHVQGAERELRQAILGDDIDETYMPIDILLPLETRADASTDVASAIQHSQQNIIGRIFAETSGAYMGVQRPSVPVGETHYYTLTGGATADVRSDGVAKDAEAATFADKSVAPVRATARYLFGVETTARIRGFEEALRADIRAVLGDKLDALALNGQAAVSSTSPVVEGIINQLTDPTNPTAEAEWDDYYGLYAARVDGKTSMDGSNVRLLVNPATYKHAVALQIETSGELLRRVLPDGRFRASANMPDAASGIATLLSYTATPRTGFVQPVWRGISLIRDVYSNAAEGQVALTAIMLTGAAMVDASQYGRHELKITA